MSFFSTVQTQRGNLRRLRKQVRSLKEAGSANAAPYCQKYAVNTVRSCTDWQQTALASRLFTDTGTTSMISKIGAAWTTSALLLIIALSSVPVLLQSLARLNATVKTCGRPDAKLQMD